MTYIHAQLSSCSKNDLAIMALSTQQPFYNLTSAPASTPSSKHPTTVLQPCQRTCLHTFFNFKAPTNNHSGCQHFISILVIHSAAHMGHNPTTNVG